MNQQPLTMDENPKNVGHIKNIRAAVHKIRNFFLFLFNWSQSAGHILSIRGFYSLNKSTRKLLNNHNVEHCSPKRFLFQNLLF